MSQCVDTARADACSAELTAISDALGTNEGHSSVDNIRLLKAEMEQLKKELGIAYCYRSLYLELLYSVSDKTPYESRHATALRYIKEREMYAKRITHCENCGDTYFDSGLTAGCPVCKYTKEVVDEPVHRT